MMMRKTSNILAADFLRLVRRSLEQLHRPSQVDSDHANLQVRLAVINPSYLRTHPDGEERHGTYPPSFSGDLYYSSDVRTKPVFHVNGTSKYRVFRFPLRLHDANGRLSMKAAVSPDPSS
ncbi:hypothetical protein J3458_008875 [Metarhizium acridum]|uniref:uncharacterized protein n=1 Tax=Metarhizium acridum TaxID=92637 RepID=UPI001C6B3096|nr:hypothetical protein J3458_008875 [Metarhizium acridum]